MLRHLGEPEAGMLLEQAVWDLHTPKRIPLMPNSAVEGDAVLVAKALKAVRKASADRK